MLVDIVLAGTPIVVVAPVVVTLLASHLDFATKGRLQKRLLGSLALVEKLPAGVVGSAQIARDIDRQSLHLAYVTQYPQRGREIRGIASIGFVLTASTVLYYALLSAGGPLLPLLAVLGLVVVVAAWLERVVVNFARNDGLVHDLFTTFRAPERLVRPHTELVLRAPTLTTEMVFERAADVRDADHEASVSTLEAVNSVLAQAHTHGAWRREARHLAHRVVHADYRGQAARAYNWLSRHVLGPLFDWRLRYLDWREHHRVARASRIGDVYKVAWLTAHYGNERRRLARHCSFLRSRTA
jgi:hypothetical protein